MSPEHMRSARDVDTRADLWALGAILYELLSAHPPFSGQSLPEVINAVMTSEPLALSQFRADVPPALEQTILRCLVKDRTLRLQTVAELATDLAAFAPRRSQHVVARVCSLSIPPSPSAQGASVSAPHEPASVRITEPAWSGTQGSASLQARANNRARWAIIGALALGLAGVSLALSRSRSIGPVNSASAGGPVEAESLIVASAPPLVGEAMRVPVSEPSVTAAVPSATSRPPVNPPQRRRVLATPKPAGELPAAATVSSSGRRRNLDIEIK